MDVFAVRPRPCIPHRSTRASAFLNAVSAIGEGCVRLHCVLNFVDAAGRHHAHLPIAFRILHARGSAHTCTYTPPAFVYDLSFLHLLSYLLFPN